MKIAFAAALLVLAPSGAFSAPRADPSPAIAHAGLATPVAAGCSAYASRSKAQVRCLERRADAAERRALRAERRAAAAGELRAERRQRTYAQEDEGGPYGPTLTNDYYFQQSIYDFQDGKKANIKEYK